ncbi:MAG: hypothetical protein J0H60_22955 [Rhizobiales bacterium]|nr:hypothetical protein [Hyphomicrobiales bacterium]
MIPGAGLLIMTNTTVRRISLSESPKACLRGRAAATSGTAACSIAPAFPDPTLMPVTVPSFNRRSFVADDAA